MPTRDAYDELLRDTRGLQREQQQARETWFAKLAADKKEDTLFELEILLKGLACFANPRNHTGSGRRQTIVSLDFHDHLAHARDGMARIVHLARAMLGERDRAFVFQRYLETVLPEDTARTRLLHASMEQESPEASLFVLRHGFTNLIEVASGLLRIPRLNFRLFYAQLAMAMREIAQSAFFNPLAALEFRPEFDRIPSAQVVELINRVPGEEAHRLAALTFLALFRMLRYLRLLDNIALDRSDRRVAGRAYLVLAVLRSDARALANFLDRRAGALLFDAFERDLLRIKAADLSARYDDLSAEGARCSELRDALTTVAASLRFEMRRTFEHDLPPADAGTAESELRSRLRFTTQHLRPALQNIIVFLAKSLGADLDRALVFDAEAPRAMSERLRHNVWMFAQIARAFASKARHVDPGDDTWGSGASFTFVRDFRAYFRAMGYPLLSAFDYTRAGEFLSAMRGIAQTDLLDPQRLDVAADECEALYDFLMEIFDRISGREELADASFDRRAAARSLRLYLGI